LGIYEETLDMPANKAHTDYRNHKGKGRNEGKGTRGVSEGGRDPGGDFGHATRIIGTIPVRGGTREVGIGVGVYEETLVIPQTRLIRIERRREVGTGRRGETRGRDIGSGARI
jgi:hypothetical protein